MRTPLPTAARPVVAAMLATLAAACGDAQPIDRALDVAGPTASQGDRAGGNPHVVAELFAPGVLSDAREQWRITFTPDGRTAYLGISDGFFPVTRQAWIYETHLVDGAWTPPQVASFSGTYSDIDPFISPDGSRLYFSSIRPVDGTTRADADVWVVHRIAGGWSAPENLGPAVNTPSDELYPSVDAAGNIFFGSTRARAPGVRRTWNIWRSAYVDGDYAPAQVLGDAVNTDTHWEFNPVVTADGRTLLFTGLNKPGGHGLGDLYVSHLHRGEWTPAQNLGAPVNSALDEYHASFSPDGRHLFFIRHSYDPWVAGDIYRIATSALGNRLQPGFTIRP